MVNPDLLQILVCPETKRPVRLAEVALLSKINTAIEAGRVRNRGGDPVRQALEGGLVREDGAVLYPVVDDIPVMLIDESIDLESLS
jgi:uncharacterized protein